MVWLSAVLIAAVSNLDNLAVGFAFGMRGRRIGVAPNVVIAAVTMAGTAGAMLSGRALAHVMSPGVASVLGSLIIIAIGAATIVDSVRTFGQPTSGYGSASRRYARAADKALSWREALVLGVALSLNNVAAGVGAGVAGIPPIATTVLAGGFSLICVSGGSRVGSSLGRLVAGERASLIGGFVLLGVGAVALVGAR